jgi:NTE family protein
MKHAITLSGGGAYGAFEVGVLKALMCGLATVTEGEALDPEIFTGTSAGAYISAVLLSIETTDPAERIRHLERIWMEQVMDSPGRGGNGVYFLRGDPRRYLDPVWLAKFPVGPLRLAAQDVRFFASDMLTRFAAVATGGEPIDRKALELFDLSALVSTEPFRELVKRTVSVETIQNSNRLIRIAATNWKTGELVTFDRADITHDAVLASAAIPGIFPAVQIKGVPYMDGGILMNTPLKAAIDLGADVIHVIALDRDIQNVPPASQPNTLDTIERLLNITNSSRIETDLKLAAAVNRGLTNDSDHRKIKIHVYRPEVDMGGVFGMLNFSGNRMRQMINDGVEEAVNHDCSSNGCVV